MKKLLTLLFILSGIVSYGQKIKIIEGDLGILKDQTSIKTEFTYSPMGVGKFPDEKDYITKKKTELNEKEAGRGDSWEESWIADRKNRFEPQFRELFAKHSGLSTVDDNAKYTLIFKTTFTEPGFNVGVMRKAAYIDGEVWIVETKNPAKPVVTLTITKSPGRDAWGLDYETGARIQEAYAKAGKELGGLIKKSKGKK